MSNPVLPVQMEYRKLGKSSLRVSALSYGPWLTFGHKVQDREAKHILQTCKEHGVNFYDNAGFFGHVYGAGELVMGRAIKSLKWNRSEYIMATRIAPCCSGSIGSALSRKRTIELVRDSLERLQIDYLDLVYCTQPESLEQVEEVVRTMNYLIDHGMTSYWGTTYWEASYVQKACSTSKELGLIGPIVAHAYYNLLQPSKISTAEYKQLHAEHGITFVGCQPLCEGILSERYMSGRIPYGSRLHSLGIGLKIEGRRTRTTRAESLLNNLKDIANELGIETISQLSIAYCLANKELCSVITGASTWKQVDENMRAVPALSRMTPDVLTRIEEAAGPYPRSAVMFEPLRGDRTLS